MTETDRLRYSRWERLIFRVTGRWPESVVERRLRAADADIEAGRRRAYIDLFGAAASSARTKEEA